MTDGSGEEDEDCSKNRNSSVKQRSTETEYNVNGCPSSSNLWTNSSTYVPQLNLWFGIQT